MAVVGRIIVSINKLWTQFICALIQSWLLPRVGGDGAEKTQTFQGASLLLSFDHRCAELGRETFYEVVVRVWRAPCWISGFADIGSDVAATARRIFVQVNMLLLN